MTLKIFRNAFFVGVIALLTCTVMFLGVMYNYYERKIAADLEEAAAFISAGIDGMGTAYLNLLSHGSRITLVAPDGEVLYDNMADAAKMENHADREEIRLAIANGTGKSVHFSNTLLEKTLYYAVKLKDGNVLRVSASQNSVFSVLLETVPALVLTVILVLVLSGILASRLARNITRPINALDMALNGSENPEKIPPYPELRPLIDRMREQKRTIRAQMDELSRSQREFAAITENMSEGFILIDTKRVILSGNKSGLALIGAGEEKTITKITRSQCRAEICSAVDEALCGARSEKLFELDGLTTQIIASPVKAVSSASQNNPADGQITGAVLLAMDVTEREQRETLRREFTANVSHELKTPLTSISGFAELMKEGLVPPEKTKEFTADIYAESQRLILLVDDIIKLSRLDENTPLPEREQVDLYDLSDDILENLRPAAQKRGIKLAITGEHIKIRGVWRILNEVIYNLCDNAIKYNKDGGEVTVNISRAENAIRLSVTDTGIGIPYAHHNRVFERFYRVNKGRAAGDNRGGTGLGLSIVKHGAAYHGARVELDSEPGRGTTVTLVFPHG